MSTDLPLPESPMDGMPTGRRKRVVETQKKPNGYGSEPKAPPPPPIRYTGEERPMDEQLAALPADAQKIIKRASKHFRDELIDCWPELTAGVRTSSREGSFSVTLQVKSAKKKRLKATLAARVRKPREALEIDMHLDESGQLALGMGPEDDDEGDE